MSRIPPQDKLASFRNLVVQDMADRGWPMHEDDDGHVMVRIEGLMDAIITSTFSVVADHFDDTEGDA
jgi:hypothetical protein